MTAKSQTPVEPTAVKQELEEVEKEEKELLEKERELKKKEQLQPWNVDTISKEGFTKTVKWAIDLSNVLFRPTLKSFVNQLDP